MLSGSARCRAMPRSPPLVNTCRSGGCCRRSRRGRRRGRRAAPSSATVRQPAAGRRASPRPPASCPSSGRARRRRATVTQSLTPSNDSALPKRPAAVRVAPEIVPALPAARTRPRPSCPRAPRSRTRRRGRGGRRGRADVARVGLSASARRCRGLRRRRPTRTRTRTLARRATGARRADRVGRAHDHRPGERRRRTLGADLSCRPGGLDRRSARRSAGRAARVRWSVRPPASVAVKPQLEVRRVLVVGRA